MAVQQGKTVTIQHLSSDQANLGHTENDNALPDTSGGGGGIGGWISGHKMMLAIIGGGAILGLIVYFYFKNQQTTAAATDTSGAATDTTSGTDTSPTGTATGTTSGTDFSPIENLLNQQQQSLDQILNAESGETGTTSSGNCPSGMHKCAKGCCCNGKNMVNKGDHCVPQTKPPAKKGGNVPFESALGGGYEIMSSPHLSDMQVGIDNPYRHHMSRSVYAMGGGYDTTYSGKLVEGNQIESGLLKGPVRGVRGPIMSGGHMPPFRAMGGSRTIMPPDTLRHKIRHWS